MKRTILLLSLLTLACSAQRPPPPAQDLSQAVESLKRRVLELQRQAAVDKVEIERLRQKVAALESRFDAAAVALRRQEEQPRGLDDEHVPSANAVQVIEVADLEEPLEELEPPQESPVPAPKSESPSAQGAQAQEVTAAAQALYDQGYSLFHQGRSVDAEETFERFLNAFGRTDLADNAQFWIGECRLSRGELQSALSAFRETVRSYESANKAPDALLRVGDTLKMMGDLDGARLSYEEVQRRYPGGPASDRAASLLDSL